MRNRPNILWIMTDQFHAGCMSFLGSQCRTPNLDGLAADGVCFERAYCNNPICAPSRANFFTGQYQHTNGIQGNRVAMLEGPHADTVAALLRRSGYRNGMFGKAHLPRQWIEEGFERIRYTDLADAKPSDPRTCHYFDYLDERGLAGWYEDGTPRPDSPGHLDGSTPADLPYEHSIEHFTGSETLSFLEDGQEDARPFFIQMSFQRPHAPMRPAREYFDLYDPDEIELPASAVDFFENGFAGKPQFMIDRLKNGCRYPLADRNPAALRQVLAAYYALIHCIDMEIGRVVDWLKTVGKYEDTIVVFTADHGDFAGDHGLFHKNFGIYESLHRIPFVVRLPQGARNERRGQIIESVDLFPTLCELCGLEIPESVEGRSLVPVLEDVGVQGKEEALCEWSWMQPVQRINALRTERYRLVYYDREIGGELYDHESDPGEIRNLWGEPDYAEVRFELMQRLFDRVNGYRARLEFRDDAVILRDERLSPTTLLHKNQADWERLKEVYETPVPARGPWREGRLPG
ncbi:MAG: sulfatase-like hydrolase/transferase [Gemmatimonadetes bacterium]|jgi:arylsulfatase A-like enzyme|nr:sulfatase-like hydrolase/transferase [Gemmatimonadota bacterium]